MRLRFNMRMRDLIRLLSVGSVLALFAGCGTPEKEEKNSGKITVNGKLVGDYVEDGHEEPYRIYKIDPERDGIVNKLKVDPIKVELKQIEIRKTEKEER